MLSLWIYLYKPEHMVYVFCKTLSHQ